MSGKKERQDVRVRDFLRLRIIPVQEEARQAVLDKIALERLTSGLDDDLYHSERMAGEMRENVELPNSQIMIMLRSLEAKIDAVMMHLLERDVEEKWGDPIPVDISASGIRFSSDQEFQIGQMLRLEILMQNLPPHPIISLSEVLRIDQQDQGWGSEKPYRVAARFIDLDPLDRDRIVKRVFDVQRMLLRRSHDAKIQPVGDES